MSSSCHAPALKRYPKEPVPLLYMHNTGLRMHGANNWGPLGNGRDLGMAVRNPLAGCLGWLADAVVEAFEGRRSALLYSWAGCDLQVAPLQVRGKCAPTAMIMSGKL